MPAIGIAFANAAAPAPGVVAFIGLFRVAKQAIHFPQTVTQDAQIISTQYGINGLNTFPRHPPSDRTPQRASGRSPPLVVW